MKQTDRQKMCTKCHGRIALDTEVCPYCGADLIEQMQAVGTSMATGFKTQVVQENLTSLYSPPYGSKNQETLQKFPEKSREEIHYKSGHASSSIASSSIAINQEEAEAEVKSSFWTLLLLSIASNLMILGLLQFFFSSEGHLNLEWDSGYWFIYCLASVPTFYFGIKKMKTLK